ncbi:MAG: hypothetical protein JWM58_2643 [Rhizobium sp.]|nr:hypothetical protein [Rhizobium sp.]
MGAGEGNSGLKTKLRMRAETHQLQDVRIRLAIDRNQIRPKVAIPVILPFAGQRMVAELDVGATSCAKARSSAGNSN